MLLFLPLLQFFHVIVIIAVSFDEETNILAAAIVDILGVSFVRAETPTVFNLYVYATLGTTQHFYAGLTDETLHRLWRNASEPIGALLGLGRALPGDHDRHYSLLLVDSSAALRQLYGELLELHLNIGGYFIIVLHPFNATELLAIFKLNWEAGIANVNVLALDVAEQTVQLYTALPYQQDRCRSIEPHLTNSYAKGRWTRGSGDFYPGKLANFYGCPFSCATWPEMPYLELHKKAAGETIELLGIEGRLLEYLAERLNFTLEFYWLNDEEIADTLKDEGAVFDRLFASGIDFAIGAFRYKPTRPSDPYAPTTPYYLSRLNVIVSSRTAPYSAFAKLLLPFVLEIWVLLGASCMVGVLIVWRLRRHGRWRNLVLGAENRTPIYNMFIVGLGGTVTATPARNLARFLLTLWLAMTLVLRSAYQAFMYHFIRTDLQMPPPESVDELLQLNYTLLMTPSTHDAVQQLPRIAGKAHVLNATSEEQLQAIRESQERLAVLTAMEYYGYYSRRARWEAMRDFHVLPELVLTQQLSIYMSKNSVMLERFNRYILEYMNAGLMSKWDQVLLDETWKEDGQRLRWQRGNEEPPQPMQFWQLLGAFRLLLLGHACSGAVLLWELAAWAVQRLWRHVAVNLV
ncbi:uncharacterized protein LOC115627659 [Scaptodrosophila lebanonensis]|uniref:Uncharacterized protein LOC115627659 n=1 Tax=Drosophila lebanonensis TaxID=7225 RepID=A0A6J2TUJ7_DROLE|nr:uncharacterized protein LOC115627659 [Scaptodrosophila lebanonensis]